MSVFKGKVAIITGAAGGLGKAIATELYNKGCHLALLDVNYADLQQLKDALHVSGQEITIYNIDIAREDRVADCSRQVIQDHGRADILVNNAGVIISQPFEQVDIDEYRRLFDINFWGAVYCTRYFLPHLSACKHSNLVFIASEFGIMGFPGKTTYASSKGAMIAFANSLKTETVRTGVQVTIVIPPPMPTGIVAAGRHTNEDKRRKEESFMQKNGMAAGRAAHKIVRGIQRNKYRIVIGGMMFWADAAARLFPTLMNYVIGKRRKKIDFY